MNYLQETRAWEDQVSAWCGPTARLIHVSSSSSDIRVYEADGRVFKMRRLTSASVHGRPNSLEDEYLVLVHLASRRGASVAVPRPLGYRCAHGWECVELERIDVPVTDDPVVRPAVETVGSLVALARAVWRLNRAGVSHGDLEPDNAGRNTAGTVALIDFDQAVFGQRMRCVLRDFVGFPAGGRVSRCSILGRAGRHPCGRLVLRVSRALRRLLGGGRHPAAGPWSPRARVVARGDRALSALAEAWELAAGSGANSPGARVAYYSLDVGGIHFPGERPWIMRWQLIQRAIDFRSKRLVELGCNMGLLSIHARMAGAVNAVGADASAGVVQAAIRAAEAFGVEARFCVVDFDQSPDWESELGHGDIVSALSLTYWLKDVDRLWRYLARFDAVLFEGHESEEQVRARFRELGYADVQDLGWSERRRKVLLARRHGPSRAS